jgi:transposase-like protein
MSKLRRTLSPELKSKIVLELVAGTSTVAQLARKHRVSAGQIIAWRKQLLERLPTIFGAELPSDRSQAKHIT